VKKDYDLLIIGGGPAGLGAAINAASEGLSTCLIDSGPELGGQARWSSLIENYGGFPDGISGTDLMGNFIKQAGKFSTELMCPQKATSIREDGDHRIVITDDDDELAARMVIITAGLSYKRLDAKNLGQFMGRGVQYGAPTSDPKSLGTCDICVVGGANSAGQAAMHLSSNPDANVRLLIRKGIEVQMSDYLVQRIRATPNIIVCEGVEVTEVSGKNSLEEVTLKSTQDGTIETIPAHHLFIFIGASPKTQWLNGTVVTDERKFILTGSRLPSGLWTLQRPPLGFETCLPGVFCAGDVRLGSTKRIASAVGEGSVAVQMCHDYARMQAQG